MCEDEQCEDEQCEELTDSQYLLDLARRLWDIPVKYDVDQGDIERLEEMAAKHAEKTFILHWFHGAEDTTITGTDIADAFRQAGYGGGSMAALDYWEQVDETT